VDWDAPVRSEGRSGLVLSVFVPFERFNDEPGLVGWRVLPRGDDELFLEIAALKLVVEVVLGSFELLLGGLERGGSVCERSDGKGQAAMGRRR